MGQLGSSRFNVGIASLVIGIALLTLARSADGISVLRGFLRGAGIALLLASAYVMGRSMRDGSSWLPRRDGQPDRDGGRPEDGR